MRWTKTITVLAAGLVLSALPYVLFWNQLPEPMAGHWGFDGRPDGATGRTSLLLVALGLVIVAGAGLALMMSRAVEGRRIPTRRGAGVAAFVSVLAIGISWSSVLVNRGVERWQDAGNLTWWILAVLGASTLAGFAFGWSSRGDSPTDPASHFPSGARHESASRR